MIWICGSIIYIHKELKIGKLIDDFSLSSSFSLNSSYICACYIYLYSLALTSDSAVCVAFANKVWFTFPRAGLRQRIFTRNEIQRDKTVRRQKNERSALSLSLRFFFLLGKKKKHFNTRFHRLLWNKNERQQKQWSFKTRNSHLTLPIYFFFIKGILKEYIIVLQLFIINNGQVYVPQ